MPHPNENDARRSHGDRLNAMTGERGEYPVDRASRIAGIKVSASATGDSGHAPEEVFTAAPARQISNYGTVKGDD
jgi:hypothetical protein